MNNNELDIRLKDRRIEQLETIIALMPGNVYWKDKQGRYLGCNSNVVKILKLRSPADIIGKTNHDLFDKHLADITTEADEQVLLMNKEYVLEEAGLNIYGEPATYFTRKVPLHDENGNVTGLLGISMDITERKVYEDALKEEKKKVEIANQVKSEFMMNMGHDLRTPFSGLISLSEFLEKQETDKSKKSILSDIVNSAKSLLSLINKILEFSHLGADDTNMRQDVFDIKNIVEECTNLIIPEIKQKKLQLLISYDSPIEFNLVGDVIKLRRIIINLLGNAIKFTKQGYIKINIQLLQQSNNIAQLGIKIEDTGIGIPENKLNIIFERFTKLSSSYNSHNNSGMGVGLYIVEQFIHDLGGKIAVTSNLNIGTQFVCDIPFTISNKKSLVQKNYPQKEFLKIENINKSINILLIEDDRIARLAAKLILEEFPCRVDIAETGKQAIELAKNDYDLIILDIGLPDIDGFEVARIIRKQKTNNFDTKIVGLTAHIDPSLQKDNSQNSSFDLLFLKPINVDMISSLLKSLKSELGKV
jgi:two-component system aerobic respiration control sensor histidine kinase ArcB